MGKSFKQAAAQVSETDWHPLYKTVGIKKIETGTQWAEICFVPNKIGHSKNGPEYRYLAKRQVLTEQLLLPGMEDPQLPLPFPTMEMNNSRYKIFGIVASISETKMNGEDLIAFLHARCGKSEEVHSIMKSDLTGGTLPCADFGKNAAWWWIMILSLNLNLMMKKLALEPSMANNLKVTRKRMKAIRFSIISLPGRVIKRSRELILRISQGHPSFKLLMNARNELHRGL